MRKISKICLFLIFTFGISYTLGLIIYLTVGSNTNQIGFTALAALYMFVPFTCVLITKKIHKERLFADLLISFKINRWFIVAWLIFPLITFCCLGISLLFPGISYNPDMTGMFTRLKENLPPQAIEEFTGKINSLPFNFIWIVLLQGLIAGITINAVAGFGEEAGWRGFLLKEFKGMHFFKAAVITGALWGVWHAPLILMGHNYPQHPLAGVFMMIIWCILLTPLFQYLTIKSKSVIAAAIAHGTLNAVAGLSIAAIDGGNDLTTGMTGLPGFIILVIFNSGIFIYDTFISKEKIMMKTIDV